MKIKYKLVAFRLEESHLDRLDQLAKRLKVKRSQTIRLSLDEAITKYMDSKYRGEIVVVDTKQLDLIIKSLEDRIQNTNKLK